MPLNLKKNRKSYACDAMRCKQRNGLTVVEGAKLCPRHYGQFQAEADETQSEHTAETVTPPAPNFDAPEQETELPVSQSSVLAIVEPVRTEAAELVGKLSAIVIRSQAGLDMAGKLLTDTKGKIKALEAQRTAVTKPLLEAKRNVDSWFQPAKDALLEAERLLKTAISGYVTAQEKARLEALQAGEHETALATEQPTLPSGVQTRTVWRFEVVDLDRVPREYMVLDAGSVQAVVNVQKGNTAIPGIRVYPDTGIRAGST